MTASGRPPQLTVVSSSCSDVTARRTTLSRSGSSKRGSSSSWETSSSCRVLYTRQNIHMPAM